MRLAWSPDLLCVAWDVPRSWINGIKAASSNQSEKQLRKTSLHAFPLFPDPRTLPSQNPLCVWLGRHPPLSHATLCVSFAYEISLSSHRSVCSPTGSSHFLFISPSGWRLLSDRTSPRTSLCVKRQTDWIWKTFFLKIKKKGPHSPRPIHHKRSCGVS